MKILFILLFITSCGYDLSHIRNDRRNFHVTTEFQPFVGMFVLDAKKFNVPIDLSTTSIKFKELDLPRVGECESNNLDKELNIRIDPSFWENSTVVSRKVLIYHELGHCILKRGHIDVLSIMQPRILNVQKYIFNEKNLIEELFTGKSLYMHNNDEICEGH